MDKRGIKEITLYAYIIGGFKAGITEIIRPGRSSRL
jgi:hypothetical protein